jgi:hypothetical protein
MARINSRTARSSAPPSVTIAFFHAAGGGYRPIRFLAEDACVRTPVT